MGNDSKLAAFITVMTFVVIVFFSLLYYMFSERFATSWDYLLSTNFSDTGMTFISSYFEEIVLIILFILVILILIYFFRK